VRDPAFELFSFPVQLIRPNSLELIKFGIQDSEVEVMAEVTPRNNEESKIWAHKRVVEVS